MSTGRLCGQEELDEMCRPGIELVHEAIDSRDPGLAAAEYARVMEARSGLVELMIEWTSTTLEFAALVETGDLAGAKALWARTTPPL
jgi:hypothetical protein